MNLEKVLTRFTNSPEDERELRRVARALGNELPRNRLEVLQSFRAEMARVSVSGSSFAGGYVAAMLDTTVQYETALQHGEQETSMRRMAMREGWHEILDAMLIGPMLPSELASRLGRDRSTISRQLRQLRVAGLIQQMDDAYDGRSRPHRLTEQGRRIVSPAASGPAAVAHGANYSAEAPAASHPAAGNRDIERGIAIAVQLFRHLLENRATPAAALDSLADSVVGDPALASAAVGRWARESERAGIVTTERDLASGSQRYELNAGEGSVLGARSTQLWQSVPIALAQRKQVRPESVPVFVRTGEQGWAAWVHALDAGDGLDGSRTIVNGDLRTRAIEPPAERFDLLYEDPDILQADRDEPTMKAFMERAEAKFVVTHREVDVPEGFIPLRIELDS